MGLRLRTGLKDIQHYDLDVISPSCLNGEDLSSYLYYVRLFKIVYRAHEEFYLWASFTVIKLFPFFFFQVSGQLQIGLHLKHQQAEAEYGHLILLGLTCHCVCRILTGLFALIH